MNKRLNMALTEAEIETLVFNGKPGGSKHADGQRCISTSLKLASIGAWITALTANKKRWR
jgi:hypothetical protein